MFPVLIGTTSHARRQEPIPSVLPPPAPAPEALRPDPDQILKTNLAPLLLRHGVPALAAAAFDADSLIASAAVGVRVAGAQDAVDLSDLWHTGSCTKAMTATLIGVLVDEGKLSWDTTLEQALPRAAAKMNPAFKPVTLAQLLRHRAGLASFTAGGSPDFQLLKDLKGTAQERRAAFARELLSRDPALPPGEKFYYSNAGYAVAAAIAEQSAGKPWEELMRERVFAPLGMVSPVIGWPANPERPAQPRGHMVGPFGRRAETLDPAYRLDPVMAPAGDVSCTIADFARFAREHLRALAGAETMLTPATMGALHSGPPPEGGDYACGWGLGGMNGQRVLRHAGSAGTFFCFVVLVPEKGLGLVAACNAGDGEAACRDAVTMMYETFAR